MGEFEFDVALSFAGEDRAYASRVAEALRSHGIRLFYDEFEAASLWGSDLVVKLDEVYRTKSRYAVIFASAHYASAIWTAHERRSAQARALQDRTAYILPVRLDDTEIPGLLSTIAHLDGRKTEPEVIAHLIEKKLNGERTAAPPTTERRALLGVPETPEDEQAVITTRPPGWEYLLLAGGVWRRVRMLDPKTMDNELGFAPRVENYITVDEYSAFGMRCIADLRGTIARLVLLMSKQSQEWALGPSGSPGDPVKISHYCSRFASAYEEMLDWAAYIRGSAADQDLRPALELMARHANEPIRQVRDFIDALVLETSKIPGHFASHEVGEDRLKISLVLTLSISEDVSSAFEIESDRLTKTILSRRR